MGSFINFVPDMTSNTAPSGVVSYDMQSGTDYGWKAFDQDAATHWTAGDVGNYEFNPHWIGYEFASAKTIEQYRFRAANVPNNMHPQDFELQGWNGSTWDTLDAVTGAAVAQGAWSPTYAIDSPAAYTKYRLYITASAPGLSVYIDIVNMAELELIGFDPSVSVENTGSVRVSPANPGHVEGDYFVAPLATLSVRSFSPVVARYFNVNSPLAVAVAKANPSFTWSVPARVSAAQIYRMFLTGAADGVPDIELPMSSFQSRARKSSSTYIGVVVPYTTENAAAISARPNGSIVIYGGPRYVSGVENLVEILRAELDRVDADRGSRNASITLHGYATAVDRPAQTRIMSGVSYVRTGESNQIRCAVDIWLRPGDAAVDETTSTSIVAGSIAYTIGRNSQIMTVSDRE